MEGYEKIVIADGAEQPETLLRAGHAALSEQRFQEAYVCALRALDADEALPGAYNLLAQIALEHGNAPKALELIKRGLAACPNAAELHAHAGRCLIALKQEAEALQAVETAIKLAPAGAWSFDTIGVTLSHLGLHERALPWFEQSVALEPANPRYLHNLGVAHQFLGDFTAAETWFRKELELAPEQRRPYSALVHLSKQTSEKNYIPDLERQFAAAAGDANARLQLGHALSKTYDDLGDYAASFDWLVRAKQDKIGLARMQCERAEPVFAAAKEAFTASEGRQGAPDEAPIFIVGMPRTGTTLTDRILSSHPMVASAGELGYFGQGATERAIALTPRTELSDANVMRAAARIDFQDLARFYLDYARKRVGDAPRFVDKMPVNFLYAGLIHRAFPNAHIICVRREPMDVVVSNYRQIFNADAAHYWYAYDLEATARYYALFDALCGFWREALPGDRYTEVAYEDIVADLEGETRRLLAFCGLDFDPRCLNFHENAAPVATASSVQVRAPLYSSSIGRWRRYGERLAPAQRILEAAGLLKL